VVDRDGDLSAEIEAQLNGRINSLNASTGMEVYIYIKHSLSGYNPPNYINLIKDTWGLDEHNKYTLLLLSAKDGKAYIQSNPMDMKEENIQISINMGMYKKQLGFENAVKYAFNTAVVRICSVYNIDDQYSFDDLKTLKQNKMLYYLICTLLIILIIALAFFFNVSPYPENANHNKPKYTLDQKHCYFTLRIYLIKNLIILFTITAFITLYAVYMFTRGKVQPLLIFIPFFIIMIFPFLRDTLFVALDLGDRDTVRIEGRVTRVFRTYFRYYFTISDSLGSSTLISSNKPLLEEDNYISALCTKKIKHITQMDMLYERIIF
jgi:hypothetical protein